MNIEKSFEWLFKRFQCQNIKPCQFDLDCLTFLAEWVNREKKKELLENELFAKLYCHVFIQEINFYKDFKFAQKSMNDILRIPIDAHYNIFTERLNNFERDQYLNSIGINDTEFCDEKVNIEELTKHIEKWKEEQVYKSLNNQITESLNRFK